MYARPMWEMMALTHSSTFSHTLSFHSNSLKFTQKLYKIQINSNKLGQMRIKLEQTCGLTVVGREQSDLTYNSTNYQ